MKKEKSEKEWRKVSEEVIQGDKYMAGRTSNVPGVWAIGDVTGKLMLAHVGSVMGIVCAENIAEHESHAGLRNDAVRNILSATDCYLQSDGGVSQKSGYTVKIGRFHSRLMGKPWDWAITRAGSNCGGREIWRDPRRPHDWSGSDGTAARAYLGTYARTDT